jgi:hypothetical protein
MIYKKILVVILFVLSISCEDNCKTIENIVFSKDIEIMSESKQICDKDISSAKWGINLKLEYDDDNFCYLDLMKK